MYHSKQDPNPPVFLEREYFPLQFFNYHQNHAHFYSPAFLTPGTSPLWKPYHVTPPSLPPWLSYNTSPNWDANLPCHLQHVALRMVLAPCALP